MKDNEIKFGFWNYLHPGIIDKDIVYKWDDMHCNLFMSWRFSKDDKKEDMIALLDEAHKLGKKVIINDERTEYLRLKEMSKEEFIKGVKECINDFNDHPATFGFYGGDEPFSDQEENFAFTMSLLNELVPDKPHYGNLLPYWSGLLGEPNELNREDSYYINKIERIVRDGKLKILAFDQYTQCYDANRDQKRGVKLFIDGMHNFLQIANKYDIPLYVSLLSVGHYSYRDPSEYDIRWQINVSLAMGAKGIIWFYFHQVADDPGYFNPPFLGEKAYITPMYGKIQRQQYIFNARFRKVFDNIDIDSYHFLGDTCGHDELKYQPDNKFIDRLDVFHKHTISIITLGHYRDDPKHKVLIVTNASQNSGNGYSIYFSDKTEKHFDLGLGEMRIFDLYDKD